MQQIFEWVKSGLLFGIFSSIIILLCPNKSYEKHINLVVGLLFILVMIHPVMTFFNLDGQTYISYIQNYIMASENGETLTDEEKEMYGRSLSEELKEMINKAGYPISDIEVSVDEKGHVSGVLVFFSGEISNVDAIEEYLKNVFGDDIIISYGKYTKKYST